jgi:hypothetical protein
MEGIEGWEFGLWARVFGMSGGQERVLGFCNNMWHY